MSNPTIDFDQIADGVTAVLERRAHGAQAAQREAEALRVADAQRQAEAVRAQQIANIRGEFVRLCDRERSLKVEIDTKRLSLESLQREISTLGVLHSHVLTERARMQQQHPFLKG
jgi:chromosome condensin MukBEF ATPase and DNA-binding subunit MukB